MLVLDSTIFLGNGVLISILSSVSRHQWHLPPQSFHTHCKFLFGDQHVLSTHILDGDPSRMMSVITDEMPMLFKADTLPK